LRLLCSCFKKYSTTKRWYFYYGTFLF